MKLQLPSAAETLILKILRDGGNWYGLEILEAADGTIAKGGLYVILSRMEDKGFITGSAEKIEGAVARAPRRYYRITGLGERSLDAVVLARATLTAATV